MSFIAIAPSSTTSAPPSDSIVANDGFFPDIDLEQMRDTMRLDGTVTAARLRNAVIAAVIAINDELQEWKARQVAAGTTELAQLQPQIGGVGVAVSQYLAAVHRTAKADLTERYRDFDATKTGEAKADQLEVTIGDDRRAARWAIRDLLGKSRSTIELI
jgi:Phage head completion protein (GPL)